MEAVRSSMLGVVHLLQIGEQSRAGRIPAELLPRDAPAVLNRDSAEFGRLEALCRDRGHPAQPGR